MVTPPDRRSREPLGSGRWCVEDAPQLDLPELTNPVSRLFAGVTRVQQVSKTVLGPLLARHVVGRFAQDWIAVLVEAVERVSLCADRVAVELALLLASLGFEILSLHLEHGALDRRWVVRIQAREPVSDPVDVVPAKGLDGLPPVVTRSFATRAGHEATAFARHDHHRVGVAERVAASLMGHESLEQREHEPRPTRDARRHRRKRELAGLFGSRNAVGERLRQSPVDVDDFLLSPRQLFPHHLGVDSVARRVREHLEEGVESLPLVFGEVRAAGSLALLDHRAEEVLPKGVDPDRPREVSLAQAPALRAGRFEPDGVQHLGRSPGEHLGRYRVGNRVPRRPTARLLPAGRATHRRGRLLLDHSPCRGKRRY